MVQSENATEPYRGEKGGRVAAEVQRPKAQGGGAAAAAGARGVSGWPKRCESARALLWEHSNKRLQLAQLLGQRGVSLTHSGLAFD